MHIQHFQQAILWPTIALAVLVYAVWFTLFVQRMRHLKQNPPKADSFATGARAMAYFEPVEMPANNLRNLFEMPVLYFALVPLLLYTGQVTVAQTVLAWTYVILRAAHSVIHVTGGAVIRRFHIYLGSCAVLLAMWIGFAIDISV